MKPRGERGSNSAKREESHPLFNIVRRQILESIDLKPRTINFGSKNLNFLYINFRS